MSETYEIINGQPQNHPNKMVTLAGLEDFLEMLKKEIPRMGTQNKVAVEGSAGDYQYLFGQGNTSNSGDYQYLFGQGNIAGAGDHQYLFGKGNTVGSNSYISVLGGGNIITSGMSIALGYDNTDAVGDVDNFILGNYNTLLDGSNALVGQSNTCVGSNIILGNYNNVISEYVVIGDHHLQTQKLTQPCFIFGRYSEAITDINALCVLAGGTAQARKNLFQINYDSTIFDKYSPTPLYKKISTPESEDPNTFFELGHLRHSMVAMGGNEAEWILEDRTSDDGANLLINIRDHGWQTPKRIYFYAGSDKTWAHLFCGDFTAQGAISGTSLNVGTGVISGGSISGTSLNVGKGSITGQHAFLSGIAYVSMALNIGEWDNNIYNHTAVTLLESQGNGGVYLIQGYVYIGDQECTVNAVAPITPDLEFTQTFTPYGTLEVKLTSSGSIKMTFDCTNAGVYGNQYSSEMAIYGLVVYQ